MKRRSAATAWTRAAILPHADGSEVELRQRLGLGAGPVFLCVGGIEARKNTTRILQAFAEIHRARPDAQLVIAGGASLLDHHDYQAAFGRQLTELGEAASAISLAWPGRRSRYARSLSPRLRACFRFGQGRFRPLRARGDGQRNAGRRVADRPLCRLSRSIRRALVRSVRFVIDRSGHAPIAAVGRCKLALGARPDRCCAVRVARRR